MMTSFLQFFILSCMLFKTVVAQVSVSADKQSPSNGDAVTLTCNITSFTLPSSWINDTSGGILSICPAASACSVKTSGRYSYNSTASTIVAHISSFDASSDDFGWKCRRDPYTHVFRFTTATSTTQGPPPNDNNTKNIIGGAVGGSVGGVALLAVAAYGCYKYKEKKKNGKAAEGKDHEAQNDEGKNGQLKEGTKSKTKESESEHSRSDVSRRDVEIQMEEKGVKSDKERPLVIDNRIGNKDESEIEYVLSKPFDPKERRPLPPLNKELKDKPIHRPQPIPSEKNDVKDQNLRGLSANFEDARGLASETPRPSKLPPIQSTVQEEDTSEEPKKNKKNRKKKNKTDEDKHADE